MTRIHSLTVYLLLLSSLSLCKDAVDQRATKALQEGDIYHVHFAKKGKKFTAKSFFELNPEIVERALTPHNKTFDLCQLQTAQCKAAMNTMSVFSRYRGTAGVLTGFVGSAALVCCLAYGGMLKLDTTLTNRLLNGLGG